MNSHVEQMNDPTTVAQPTRCPKASVRRPPSSRKAAPNAGSAMTSTSGSASEPAADGSTTGMS